MQIKEKIANDTAILTFKGSIISEPDTTKMREKIYSLVTDGIKHVIIDLGGVDHVSSLGLGGLISALTTMRKAGGDIRLARVAERVQNLLVITRLVKIFDTYESVKKALMSYETERK